MTGAIKPLTLPV